MYILVFHPYKNRISFSRKAKELPRISTCHQCVHNATISDNKSKIIFFVTFYQYQVKKK